MDRDTFVSDLQRHWAREPRWRGITRPYTAADVWRLRTGPLSEAAARDLCARLRQRRVDCVPVAE